MKPLQISPDTAIKLSKKLGVPIEHLMHMPQHILMQKLMELANEQASPAEQKPKTDDAGE
jgi:plasmid maintenance system antidote protein VapI